MAVLADHLGVKLAELGRQIWEGPDDDPFGPLVGLLSLQQHVLEWALGRPMWVAARRFCCPSQRPSQSAPRAASRVRRG